MAHDRAQLDAPMGTCFRLIPARPEHRDDLLALAAQLDTVNLPADPATVESIIAHSVRSFAQQTETNAAKFLFVLEDTSKARIVGSSMVIAAHGTIEDPHHFFAIDTDERFSATLKTLFRHRTLRFRQSYTPHTELGALILDRAYRGRPERLGTLLSYGRLLYVAAHRERFHQEIQAELLPPLRPDGTSILWEWLGKRFTGLTYSEADRLSRTNQEFIRALFPREAIYIALMPPEVERVVGAVGHETRGVEKMLRAIGFTPNGHIDPFDGGPHFSAQTDAIPIIRDALSLDVTQVRVRSSPASSDQRWLVAGEGPDGFRVTFATGRRVASALELDDNGVRNLALDVCRRIIAVAC